MGFIDYVIDYFKGPTGLQGEPGISGEQGPPGASLDVTDQVIEFVHTVDTTDLVISAPSGTVIVNAVVLGDLSGLSFYAKVVHFDGANVLFEYQNSGPTFTVQLLLFVRPV